MEIKKDPAPVADLFATMVECFGVNPNKRYDLHDCGAVRVTDKGNPIKALIS